MDFPKFQELVTNRTGFAQMADPTATGEYFSDSCGDMYTFYLKIDDARQAGTSPGHPAAPALGFRPRLEASTECLLTERITGLRASD